LNCASAGNGRAIFPTPRAWWGNSNPVTLSKSARGGAAATAARSSGRAGRVVKMSARGTWRPPWRPKSNAAGLARQPSRSIPRQPNACAPRVDRRMAARRAPDRRRAKLPLELGGERHCAGAATGAAHGDENVLLLLLVEIGSVEQLSRLLLEQRVQRERAIRNLVLGRPLRSRFG